MRAIARCAAAYVAMCAACSTSALELGEVGAFDGGQDAGETIDASPTTVDAGIESTGEPGVPCDLRDPSPAEIDWPLSGSPYAAAFADDTLWILNGCALCGTWLGPRDTHLVSLGLDAAVRSDELLGEWIPEQAIWNGERFEVITSDDGVLPGRHGLIALDGSGEMHLERCGELLAYAGLGWCVSVPDTGEPYRVWSVGSDRTFSAPGSTTSLALGHDGLAAVTSSDHDPMFVVLDPDGTPRAAPRALRVGEHAYSIRATIETTSSGFAVVFSERDETEWRAVEGIDDVLVPHRLYVQHFDARGLERGPPIMLDEVWIYARNGSLYAVGIASAHDVLVSWTYRAPDPERPGSSYAATRLQAVSLDGATGARVELRASGRVIARDGPRVAVGLTRQDCCDDAVRMDVWITECR